MPCYYRGTDRQVLIVLIASLGEHQTSNKLMKQIIVSQKIVAKLLLPGGIQLFATLRTRLYYRVRPIRLKFKDGISRYDASITENYLYSYG